MSTLFIYPLDMPLHGLSMFILTTSLMFTPFLMFGSGAVAINNYQEFRTDDRRDNGFLSVIFSMYLFGSALFALAFFFGGDWMSKFFYSGKAEYNKYFGYILPLTILQAGCALIDVYLNNFTKVIIPALFKEFLLKLTLPLLIGLHVLGYISIQTVMIGLLGNYLLALILLLIYTFYLRRHSFTINFKFLNNDRVKRITNYAFFAILGAFGSQLVNYLDIIMIKAILPPLEFISVYATHYNLANFINMPIVAIIAVAGPLVARYIGEKNDEKLAHIYKSSSTIMLLLGCFLTACIMFNMESIYGLMANGDAYRSGFMVFVFLGLAKLFDMATGLNSQIIGYSKYYKFNFYSVMILGLLNTVFNYALIHRMGISGAALATLISMTLFNVFKLWYVKKKFGIWPFTMKDLYILMITIGLGTMVYFIPAGDNNYVQIIVRSGIFTLLFWAIAIKFDFSPQVSMYFWGVVKRLKGN
ncbi:MAG: polysaccharide biosynthesis C-terminal domain-containing protein [Saprospiraceae bacterium]|nr:polysaccharide biosynthesis C-terminal domain-containing protein [Candidatus Brachybacter algidus]